MRVIPAIDLMDGKCVRLIKGDKDKVINYDKDPLQLAQEYLDRKARIVHVIDLDGAFSGEMKNLEIIKSLAAEFPIQVGGGIRSEEKIIELLNLGVKKVIVSTMLLGDQRLAARIKKKYYGRLISSFDFKDGSLSYAGWTKQSRIPFEKAAEGLSEIVVTDTSRDGTLNGPNLELLASLQNRCKAKIIAAGGVRDTIDLIKLDSAGVDAAIVGRAFLENLIDSGDIIKFEGRGCK